MALPASHEEQEVDYQSQVRKDEDSEHQTIKDTNKHKVHVSQMYENEGEKDGNSITHANSTVPIISSGIS